MTDAVARSMLWFAALVLGAYIGAAIYEMIVVTPLWAGNPPQSVRGFNPVAEFAVQPLGYKIPALAVVAFAGFGLLSVGATSPSGRAWALAAGALALTVAIATIVYAIPILRRLVVENGAGLNDVQIVELVRSWIVWSRMRLLALLLAWCATIAALLRRSAPQRRLFDSDLRWK